MMPVPAPDRVVVERGVDLYLTRVQKLHRFLLVLRPAFKKHRADHAAPVQHDHVVQVYRRSGVQDHVILQSFHDLPCREHVDPPRVVICQAGSGSLVGFRDFLFHIRHIYSTFTTKLQEFIQELLDFGGLLERRNPLDLRALTPCAAIES